jgi:hypothetical protein
MQQLFSMKIISFALLLLHYFPALLGSMYLQAQKGSMAINILETQI